MTVNSESNLMFRQEGDPIIALIYENPLHDHYFIINVFFGA